MLKTFLQCQKLLRYSCVIQCFFEPCFYSPTSVVVSSCVIYFFVRGYFALFSLCYFLILCHSLFQEKEANFAKEAKARQREVRLCEYTPCQVKAKDGATLLKCAGCRSALYCCKDHAVLHRPEHESLCEELTRLCDCPGCEERAEVNITCRRCKVATYCSKRHREKNSSAHESSGVCEELRALRKGR